MDLINGTIRNIQHYVLFSEDVKTCAVVLVYVGIAYLFCKLVLTKDKEENE